MKGDQRILPHPWNEQNPLNKSEKKGSYPKILLKQKISAQLGAKMGKEKTLNKKERSKNDSKLNYRWKGGKLDYSTMEQ